jgi:hypothetical protein
VSAPSDEYFSLGGYFSEVCFSSLVEYTIIEKNASLKYPPNKPYLSEDAETGHMEQFTIA